MFLGEILYSHSASLSLPTQGYKWVPRKITGKSDEMLRGNLAMDWLSLPGAGGEVIALVASCCGNRDRLALDGPLGSSIHRIETWRPI